MHCFTSTHDFVLYFYTAVFDMLGYCDMRTPLARHGQYETVFFLLSPKNIANFAPEPSFALAVGGRGLCDHVRLDDARHTVSARSGATEGSTAR